MGTMGTGEQPPDLLTRPHGLGAQINQHVHPSKRLSLCCIRVGAEDWVARRTLRRLLTSIPPAHNYKEGRLMSRMCLRMCQWCTMYRTRRAPAFNLKLSVCSTRRRHSVL
jgi:hypothetical protein